jgi:hypothetical protein
MVVSRQRKATEHPCPIACLFWCPLCRRDEHFLRLGSGKHLDDKSFFRRDRFLSASPAIASKAG